MVRSGSREIAPMAMMETTVVIKKVKKVQAAGHHGGAWKVAYADFVTAMMAFFLLMWLINTTSPEQKRGVADYFAPASVSESTSGSGGILGGTALGDDGNRNEGSSAVVSQLAPESPTDAAAAGQSSTAGALENASDAAIRELKFVARAAVSFITEAVVGDVVERGAAFEQMTAVPMMKIAPRDRQALDRAGVKVMVVAIGALVVGEFAVLDIQLSLGVVIGQESRLVVHERAIEHAQ